MREAPLAQTGDAKPGRAIRIRTGDLGVGRHPVAGMARPLLRRQQGEEGRKGVDRKALSRWQVQHLAAQLEPIAGLGAAIDRPVHRRDDLDAQVIELEAVVDRSVGHPYLTLLDFTVNDDIKLGRESKIRKPGVWQDMLEVRSVSKHF